MIVRGIKLPSKYSNPFRINVTQCRNYFFDQKVTSFEDLPLSSHLIKKLNASKYKVPATIQVSAIKALRSGADGIITAPTGSGKSLAYLMPLLDNLIGKKPVAVSSTPESVKPTTIKSEVDTHTYPRGLVLVPSGELAFQIADTVDEIDRNIGVHRAIGSWRPSLDVKEFHGSMIVGTPTCVARSIKHDFSFSQIDYVVFDEADMLLDGDYKSFVQKIIRHLQNRTKTKGEPKRQFVFCGATLPNNSKFSPTRWLYQNFRRARVIKSTGLHKVNPLLKMNWIDIRGVAMEKELLNAIAGNEASQLKTIVFTNTSKNAEKIHNFLQENSSSNVVRVHKNTPETERMSAISSMNSGKARILVATDLAARGIDIENVEHIVQADFAQDVIKYLHRIGRTARAGRRGMVTNFIGDQDMDLMKLIKSADRGKLESLFSRRRGLRKKLKKKSKALSGPHVNKTISSVSTENRIENNDES